MGLCLLFDSIELWRRLRRSELLQYQGWGIAIEVNSGIYRNSRSCARNELYFSFGNDWLADHIDVGLIAVGLVVDVVKRSLLIQKAFYLREEGSFILC